MQIFQKLYHNTVVMVTVAIIGVVIVAGVCFLLGRNHALDRLSFNSITATQAATAMRQDNFYGLYGENILTVTGVVATLQTSGGSEQATFTSSDSYMAMCQFDSTPSLKAGQTISVQTIGGQAERKPTGVLLRHCVLRSS